MYEMIPIAFIVVSGILLFPVVVSSAVRKIRQPPHANPGRSPEIAQLEAELQQTREELKRLSERQQFVEGLLEKRSEPSSLPR